MKYTTIPNTDIKVSKICLGTMTFGNQNSEAEAHEQMNYALDQGVNFFDTAEMYAVPPSKETQGLTEQYIGNWFAQTGNRDKVVLATKATGPGRGMGWVRPDLTFKKANIKKAIEGSLKRLKTDYIDLYQLHWPERNVNIFGQRNFKHDPNEAWEANFDLILEALQELVKEGKVKEIGVSNETPYGMMRYKELARKGLPQMQTIQNPYSLLNRTFEYGLSEICIRESVGLLAYSPLGFGILSGKYIENPNAVGRVSLFPRYSRYSSPQAQEATMKYYNLAKEWGVSLTHLSLAFINQQSFVTSNIIGATTMEQLKQNISSINLELSEDQLEAIDAIHAIIPNPAP